MIQNLKNTVLVVITFFAFAACNSDDDGPKSPSSEPLVGKVNGMEFRATGGKAFDRGEGEVSINLTNVETTCDDSVLDYDLQVSFTVPLEGGSYDGEFLNVVFSADGETPLNLIGSSVVEINSIDIANGSGTIIGKVSATWDDDNTVNGTFTVDYCE